MHSEFDNAILQISENIRRTLQFIPDDVKHKCEEIRIREDLPVCLTVDGRVIFVQKNSSLCNTLPSDPLIATKQDLQNTISLLCNNSVYLHESEIKQGFVALRDGNRAGVCGVFNVDGMLVTVTSINIRIARQIFGCADLLIPYVQGGLLIAGPPGCGKTTILRDLIRSVSNGEAGDCQRVSVIDSRREISGNRKLDLGVNTDVLYTLDKATGIDIALRTMYPDFIAFDEIGTVSELSGISSCFNAGVGIITTVHCNDKSDILERELIKEIIKNGAISYVVVLSKKREDVKIISTKELKRCLQSSCVE